MPDFLEMTRKAKEDAASAEAKRVADAAEVKRLDDERMASAAAVINERVLPSLYQAAAAFEAEGIGCTISDGSSYSDSTGPKLIQVRFATIRCHALADGANPQALRSASGTMRFEHDGSRLSAKASWEGKYAGYISGSDDHIVEEGIRKAIEYYLANAGK